MRSLFITALAWTALAWSPPALARTSCPFETHVRSTFRAAPSPEGRIVVHYALRRILDINPHYGGNWGKKIQAVCGLRPEEQQKWIERIQFDTQVRNALEGKERRKPMLPWSDPDGTYRFLNTPADVTFLEERDRWKSPRRTGNIIAEMKTVAPLALYEWKQDSGYSAALGLTCTRSPNGTCEAFQFQCAHLGGYGVEDYVQNVGPEMTLAELEQLREGLGEKLTQEDGQEGNYLDILLFAAHWRINEAGALRGPLNVALNIVAFPYVGPRDLYYKLKGDRRSRTALRRLNAADPKSVVVLNPAQFMGYFYLARDFHY